MNYDIRYIYKITNTIVFMIVVLIYILYCRDLVFTLDLRFVEENVRKFPKLMYLKICKDNVVKKM